MKPGNYKFKVATTGLALVSQLLTAAPSGLDSLPVDVKIPSVGGRAIPVELLPALNDNNTVYVKPLEGEFVSQGVVKSPLTDCNLIKEELKIAEINVEARKELANILRQAQIDHQRTQDEYKQLVKQYEELTSLVSTYEEIVAKGEGEKRETMLAYDSVKKEIAGVRDLMALEDDPAKLKALQSEKVKLEAELKDQKRALIDINKRVREADGALTTIQLKLASIAGKKRGMEKTFLVQTEELGNIQVQLSRLQDASDAVLQKYSERIGGYTTFTADFAPSHYIQELKNANPKYQFQYVPSITAVVDTTIPDNITPGSPLDARIGTLILDAKWSDPERARSEKRFTKHLIEAKEAIKDPVKLSQNRMPELESSLTGTKYLAMKLSILGYCALKEPVALSSQFVGGAADTFKLALYYTYPVNYAIRLKGRYNAYSTLYEMHKRTSSSSWFGLRKKQKQEHVRDIKNTNNIQVKVEPIGYELTPQESLELADKVKDQLVYFTTSPFMDTKGDLGKVQADAPGQLGATTVSKRLMMIPNPYAFWGGIVLGALGEMFGSSSSESVRRLSESSWTTLDYDMGFSFLHSGDITIGDLKRVPVTNE